MSEDDDTAELGEIAIIDSENNLFEKLDNDENKIVE